jgi:[acyl-carrier-protein] S-malonyltransferase/trans-AT polyketide synthase/acyltransferase/oxidoreductase domain-containing protein
MAGIENQFRSCLEASREGFQAARAEKVTSNYTGKFHPGNREAVVDNLVLQISGTVQWRENMTRLSEKAETVFEIGPHRPLKQFFGSINVDCKSITTLASAERIFCHV